MPSMIPIPAGTPQANCRSCGQSIYFAPFPTTGRPHPVSVAHEDAQEPTPFADGVGISHFEDCPTADQHRTGGERRVRTQEELEERAQRHTLDLRTAKQLPLMGATTSWDGYGTRPLGGCPDKVLRAARRFFTAKLRERPNPRMASQLAAIALILTERESNSPQQALAL
jgi:hypothetical protein